MFEVELPYPPSVNHYWRMVGSRMLISREGRAFRQRVCPILKASAMKTVLGRLAVKIEICPPDHRRRDIDNVQKAVLDALEKGGAYEDDSQIDLLISERRALINAGAVIVRAMPYPCPVCPLCGAKR